MKKTIIALSISSLLYSSLSIAEETSTAKINNAITADENMVITANPYKQSTDEVMSTVSIITRLDIDRIQPKSIAELLKSTAGIDIAANGGPGQNTSVFVRGTNSTHTLFLVDGVRINTVTGSGGASVNNIPTYQIERIEVVKGPRAAMYGSDAVGAVIQIFTRKLKGGEYQTVLESGSNDYIFAGATAGISHGDGSTTVSVSKETTDGYDITTNDYSVDDDKDAYERVNISLNGEQRLSNAFTLSWVGRYDDGDYDYDGNSKYTSTAPGQEYKKHLLSTGLNYAKDYWSHDINIAQYQEENTRLGDYPAVDETTRNQVDYMGVYNTRETFSFNFGTQFYQDEYTGSNDAFSGQSRDTLSAFAGVLYNRDAFISEFALRYNDVEDTGAETTYNISLGYNLTDAIFTSINYGTGFKAPTLYQLYDSWSGNAALKLETSESWEFLLRGDVYGVNTELSYFNIGFDDMLDYNSTSRQYDNIADAKIKGVEFNASKSVGNLDVSTNYTYTDTEDKTTGTQLSRRARHKANLQATYDWEQVSLTGIYQYQGTRFDEYSNSSLSAYNTLDLGVNYQLNDAWKLQLKANNIFDADYETAPGYTTPGTEYYLQVSYSNL